MTTSDRERFVNPLSPFRVTLVTVIDVLGIDGHDAVDAALLAVRGVARIVKVASVDDGAPEDVCEETLDLDELVESAPAMSHPSRVYCPTCDEFVDLSDPHLAGLLPAGWLNGG